MIIKQKFKYISEKEKWLVEHGYAKLYPYKFRFDRYFTEEEMEKNLHMAKSMSKAQWAQVCIKTSKYLEVSMKKILETLNAKYDIHQVDDEKSSLSHYHTDWDLFFFSNKMAMPNRVMDWFDVSVNEKRDYVQNCQLVDEIQTMIAKMDYPNVGCYIHYKVFIDEEKIEKSIDEAYVKAEKKYITYRRRQGKIKRACENGTTSYVFIPKYAKKMFYALTEDDVIYLSGIVA